MKILKTKYILGLIAIANILSGCVTSQVRNTDTKNNEAVIFGRFVITGEKEINYGHMIAYLYSEDGSPIMAELDKDGYFYTKARIGRLHLDRLDYLSGIKSYSILSEYKFADILKSDEVYYIGDINLNWSPDSKAQTNKFTLKAEKPMREVIPTTPLDVRIDNNTINFLNEKFPENTKPIRISVLR